MSMLLDALKRIDGDERRMRAPDIDDILAHEPESPHSGPARLLRITAVALLVILALSAFVWIARLDGVIDQTTALRPAHTYGASDDIPGKEATKTDPHSRPVTQREASVQKPPGSESPSDFRIDGHMVVTGKPGLGRVFVAGRTVRIGEELGDGVVLRDVRPGIALLDVGGELREVPLR